MKLLSEQLFKLQDKSTQNDTAKHLLEKVGEIIEKNTVYSTYNTSVLKKEHKDYDNFIEMIKKTSKEDLERNRRSKNTFVLDGVWVQTVIKTNSETKTIHTHAPRKDSHPEINDLIVNTLILFRDKNIILDDPYRTVGY